MKKLKSNVRRCRKGHGIVGRNAQGMPGGSKKSVCRRCWRGKQTLLPKVTPKPPKWTWQASANRIYGPDSGIGITTAGTPIKPVGSYATEWGLKVGKAIQRAIAGVRL